MRRFTFSECGLVYETSTLARESDPAMSARCDISQLHLGTPLPGESCPPSVKYRMFAGETHGGFHNYRTETDINLLLGKPVDSPKVKVAFVVYVHFNIFSYMACPEPFRCRLPQLVDQGNSIIFYFDPKLLSLPINDG